MAHVRLEETTAAVHCMRTQRRLAAVVGSLITPPPASVTTASGADELPSLPKWELVQLEGGQGHFRTPPSSPPLRVTQQLLNSPRNIPPQLTFDSAAYAARHARFAMAASVEVTRGGRLWTCWAGGEDGPDAYLLASYSDGSEHGGWVDPVFAIDPQARGIAMGTRLGSLWLDPRGRLWLFFHQCLGMFDGCNSNWYVRCDDPDAVDPAWTEPVYIGFGASLNKPITVPSTGEWLLPVSLWERWHIDEPFSDCHHEFDGVRGACVFVSSDEGESWRYRGGTQFENSCFNEHHVVALEDGKGLWMLSRCMQGTAQAFSYDGGNSWVYQSEAFPHVSSRCGLKTLASGRLLLVKHGQSFAEATKGRSHLTAFLSKDGNPGSGWLEPSSWDGRPGLLLDERERVSYPDIAQGPDGTIYVHYDRDRTGAAEILVAQFTEQDVLAGELVSASSQLKCLVKSKDGMNR